MRCPVIHFCFSTSALGERLSVGNYQLIDCWRSAKAQSSFFITSAESGEASEPGEALVWE
jgi:hypothetical protein